MSQERIITGTIVLADGADREGIQVHAFDRDLPSVERRGTSPPRLLAESTTDAEGRFQLSYTLAQFQSGEAISPFRRVREKNADLSLRVLDVGGRALSISTVEAGDRKYRADQIIFNVPALLEGITIFLDAPDRAGTSELEQLIALLAPVLDDLPIALLSDDDIAFLGHEFGLEQQPELQQRIDWLRRSAILAGQTRLPLDAFYGWGRKDVPARFAELAMVPVNDLPAILKKLRAQDTALLRGALLAAIDDNIIRAGLREEADAILRDFGRGAQVRRVATIALSDAASGLPLAGYTVTTVDRSAADEDLGLDITDSRGRFAVGFYSPFQLPTGAPPRQFLFSLAGRDGAALPDLGPVDIRPDADEADVVEVKVELPAAPALSLPEQLRELQIDTPELLAYFSDQRIASFAAIRSKGGINRLPDLPRLPPDTLQQLASLADLDRLALSVSASSELIKQRYDSVLAIAEAPASEFVHAVAGSHAELSELDARKLHLMAQAQTSILSNLLVEMASAQANGYSL